MSKKKRDEQQLSRFGRKVYRKLNEKGWSVWALEEMVEEKLGCFLYVGYLKKHLRKGKHVFPKVYRAICEILGIPDATVI